MSTARMTDEQCREILALIKKYGTALKASKATGISRTTLATRLETATVRMLNPDKGFDGSTPGMVEFIRARPRTMDSVQQRFKMTKAAVKQEIGALADQGYNVFVHGERISIEKRPVPRRNGDSELYTFESDDEGKYRFGVVSDNHLGSKYAREDVLHDLYDWFAREGITRVYNCGNWIDGEARFNKFDLKVHGMQNQLDYFAKNYPRREGITTYYVAGDDHEGWYCKDVGVDIGTMAETTARDKEGRHDLRYLGYMESYIALTHKQTGRTSQLMCVHPGGGSSYAISYAPQKFVEALQGGEKPAVVIFGHWHKMDVFNYRNTWIIQAGTTEDQTPFMRKLKLEAHVGGLIVGLKQDERGAIMECSTTQKRYFDRSYHNGSFSMSGPIKERAKK